MLYIVQEKLYKGASTRDMGEKFKKQLKAISKEVDADGNYRMFMYYTINSYPRAKWCCTKYKGKWYIKEVFTQNRDYLADQSQNEDLDRLWESEENTIDI